MPGIVLDTGAVAHLLHHLQIIIRALLDALCLKQLALCLKCLDLFFQLGPDILHRDLHVFIFRHIMRSRKNHDMRALTIYLTGDNIKFGHAVHLIAEQLNAYGPIIVARREHLDHIAAHPETATLKRNVIAFIADGHQLPQNCLPLHFLPFMQGQHHLMIALR